MRELVRHIRDQKLRMTFTDALGQVLTSRGTCRMHAMSVLPMRALLSIIACAAGGPHWEPCLSSSQAQSEGDGVSSQKEARRLAFYLFWNVRSSYDRRAASDTIHDDLPAECQNPVLWRHHAASRPHI